MLNIEESQQLMEKFIELRAKSQESNSPKDIREFKNHENLCLEKFKYIIFMRTSRYKSFSNYDDLNQSGYEALIKSMKTYNPKKGCFFWWAHRYIDTKIFRNANSHTTIRYPIKFARENSPRKELSVPQLISEDSEHPDTYLERKQIARAIQKTFVALSDTQQEAIILSFGLDERGPLSVNKVCRKLNLSRSNCIKIINESLVIMSDIIKI